ncbi:MAG TPA: hypothetical protein VH482_14940, partial [Thermomicrobiales bacterium]
MPRRVTPHAHWNPDDTRRDLITSASNVDLLAGDLAVRATAVPLFRGSDGGLQQAIRLWIESPRACEGVVLSAQSGERVLDQTTMAVPAGEASFHVFVPEVNSP